MLDQVISKMFFGQTPFFIKIRIQKSINHLFELSMRIQQYILNHFCFYLFIINNSSQMKVSNIQNQLLERRTIRLIPNEEEPDFFLILRTFTFPLKKSILNGSHYFKRLNPQKNSTHVLTQCLDVKAVTFVLNSMHGKRECYPRTAELLHILDAALFFQYPVLQQRLAADISNHFDDYGFFLLLKIAQKLKLDWLLKKLCKEILDVNFEQLNYNKIDLFQYDRKSFISVMRKHFKLQQNKIIKGLSRDSILSILKEYSQINNLAIHKRQILCSNSEDDEFALFVQIIKEELAQKAISPTRRRSRTNNNQKKLLSESLKKQQSNSTNQSNPSQNNLKVEVRNLLSINSIIKLKNTCFMSEISEIKQHLSERSFEEEPQTATRYLKASEQKIDLMEKQWQQMEMKYSKIFDNFKQKLEQNFSEESVEGSDQEYQEDLSISMQLGTEKEFKVFSPLKQRKCIKPQVSTQAH